MIKTVYDDQDHHEDCLYPTVGDPEPCLCEELTAAEVWPQDEDENAA